MFFFKEKFYYLFVLLPKDSSKTIYILFVKSFLNKHFKAKFSQTHFDIHVCVFPPSYKETIKKNQKQCIFQQLLIRLITKLQESTRFSNTN